MVQAIHTVVKGRARYKVDGLYRSDALKHHLESGLSHKKGISRISINTSTGSILVLFNSDNTHDTVAALIRDFVRKYRNGASPSFPGSFKQEGLRAGKQGDRPQRTIDLSRAVKNVRIKSREKIRKLVGSAEEQAVEAWHALEPSDVLNRLEVTGDSGLTRESAQRNLMKYGPNLLPESVPRSAFSILFGQVNSIPNALLGVAAGLSLFTGGLADAVVIVSVVAINTVIGYVTESQAEKTIHSLKSLVRPSSLVKREGFIKEIPADEVAIGDILVLRPGSYIAADSRLIETSHLSVDESALTGESLPVIKTLQAVADRNILLADRLNMVYMGTLVTGGQGLAVVVATGKYTEIGRIQTLVGEAQPPETPMERQLSTMGTQLVVISGAVCGLVFVIGLLRGYGFLQMLKTSISLAVAAVPEGLPTVATTTLALGIRNMKRHNVLIRHLDAVETLGSVQTICLDKTGTLTMNRMSVVSIHTGMRRVTLDEGRFFSGAEIINPYAFEEFLRLIHVSVLCNETEVIGMQDDPRHGPDRKTSYEDDEGKYVLRGSPTENSLIHMAISAGVDILELREKFPLLKISHRSENRNYMSTLHSSIGQSKIIALKGSPGEVLSMCNWHIRDGRKAPLTNDDRYAIETENERMAGDALRVLGLAYFHMENGDDGFDMKSGFVWLGLIGMADPIRKGVRELMGLFHQSGIETVMITGDQSPTAYAIGKELNLSNGGQLEILDSTHLANIDPAVMKALCERVHVFVRVSPAHKLQIVQALQGTGRVVAMTGDGINDGPALKAADIGVAMGHTGTDVAREVADIVVEDDNLETMIIAVSQGRTIYNNIRKSVHFLLSTNISEIMVMFTAIAGGMGQPLNAMQLLWINLISDIFPGLALALEPPEPDVLSRPPRSPEDPIIKTSDFKRIAFESGVISAGTLGAYGYGIMRYGIGPRAGTLAFMGLTSSQLLHALSCRSENTSIFDKGKLPPNRYLDLAIGGSMALQVLTLAIPGLRSLLGLSPINLVDALVVGGGATIPLLINEGTKSKQTQLQVTRKS